MPTLWSIVKNQCGSWRYLSYTLQSNSYGIQRSTVTKDPFCHHSIISNQQNQPCCEKNNLSIKYLTWVFGIVAQKHEPLVTIGKSPYKPRQSPNETPSSIFSPARREARNGRRRRRPKSQSYSAPRRLMFPRPPYGTVGCVAATPTVAWDLWVIRKEVPSYVCCFCYHQLN